MTATLKTAALALLLLLAQAQTARATTTAQHQIYVPLIANPPACPAVSINSYDLVPADGVYKNNALTDENADFRLSVLGYASANAGNSLVDYGGATDPGAPRFRTIVRRIPAISAAYKRHDWNWNETGPPPYGARGGVNSDWPASVIDVATTRGEAVYIPERAAQINGGVNAMVLYAGPDEITFAYYRQDSVASGYVVHMTGLCVDSNLLALYRAQLNAGHRATGQLPALRNNQPIGVARDTLTLAVRDRGAYLDPRSRKDWWQ